MAWPAVFVFVRDAVGLAYLVFVASATTLISSSDVVGDDFASFMRWIRGADLANFMNVLKIQSKSPIVGSTESVSVVVAV